MIQDQSFSDLPVMGSHWCMTQVVSHSFLSWFMTNITDGNEGQLACNQQKGGLIVDF